MSNTFVLQSYPIILRTNSTRRFQKASEPVANPAESRTKRLVAWPETNLVLYVTHRLLSNFCLIIVDPPARHQYGQVHTCLSSRTLRLSGKSRRHRQNRKPRLLLQPERSKDFRPGRLRLEMQDRAHQQQRTHHRRKKDQTTHGLGHPLAGSHRLNDPRISPIGLL